MGIELELATLLLLTLLGQTLFARFEIETPRWRLLLKWLVLYALTLGSWALIGHLALVLPVGAGVGGLAFHLWWCRRHGIHWLEATPRDRYYELRGWRLPSEESTAD